jgi:hypothetical protein
LVFVYLPVTGANTATEMANNDLFLVAKDPLKNPYLKKQAPGKRFFK